MSRSQRPRNHADQACSHSACAEEGQGWIWVEVAVAEQECFVQGWDVCRSHRHRQARRRHAHIRGECKILFRPPCALSSHPCLPLLQPDTPWHEVDLSESFLHALHQPPIEPRRSFLKKRRGFLFLVSPHSCLQLSHWKRGSSTASCPFQGAILGVLLGQPTFRTRHSPPVPCSPPPSPSRRLVLHRGRPIEQVPKHRL